MTKGTQQFNSKIENYGYIETTKFNGKKANKGRQKLEVTRAAFVPTENFTNKSIVAKCLLTGKKGAEFEGMIMKDNRIVVTYSISRA